MLFRRRGWLVFVVALVIALVLAVLLLTRGPRTARIVDCAPGYHNISGAESDCGQLTLTPAR